MEKRVKVVQVQVQANWLVDGSKRVECPTCHESVEHDVWVSHIQDEGRGDFYSCPSCHVECTPSEIDDQVFKISK